MRLRFRAGRLDEYHGEGIHLKDGEISPELDPKIGRRLLDDFPDMFEERSDTAERGEGGQTPESATANLSRFNKAHLIAFVREAGFDPDGLEDLTKRQIVEEFTKWQTAQDKPSEA